MSFLFKSKKQKQENIVAIFDIGSGSVGGAIVKLVKNGSPVVYTSSRNDIKQCKELNYEDFSRNMSIALTKTANDILNKKITAPKEIFCVLASPWYVSENRVTSFKRDRSFVFTKKMADKLLEKEISNITESHNSKYYNQSDVVNSPNIIEKHVLSVFLDEKNTPNPINKKCKNVSMNLVVSFSLKSCISKIEESINRIFHTKKINFMSFTSAVHLVLRDKYIKENSYIILDIAGEVTDIGLVEDGLLIKTASFPFGRNSILKSICNELDIEFRDAVELLKLYNRDNIFSSYKEKVAPIIKNVDIKWQKYFNDSLSMLVSSSNIPNSIFVIADNEIKDFITPIINNTENYNILHNNKYHIEKIESGDLLGLCDFANGNSDPFIMLEAIAINKKNSINNK